MLVYRFKNIIWKNNDTCHKFYGWLQLAISRQKPEIAIVIEVLGRVKTNLDNILISIITGFPIDVVESN